MRTEEEEYPPVVLEDGTKQWWRYGCLHREGGPAVEWADRTKQWIVYGQYHRTDGPAVEFGDGKKQWFYKDEYLFNNFEFLKLEGNYTVLERGIPTDMEFGELEITIAKLLTANGIMSVPDNLPGLDIGEGND